MVNHRRKQWIGGLYKYTILSSGESENLPRSSYSPRACEWWIIMSGQFSDSPRRKNGVFVIFYINIEEKSNLTFYLDLPSLSLFTFAGVTSLNTCFSANQRPGNFAILWILMRLVTSYRKHVFLSQSAAWKFSRQNSRILMSSKINKEEGKMEDTQKLFTTPVVNSFLTANYNGVYSISVVNKKTHHPPKPMTRSVTPSI